MKIKWGEGFPFDKEVDKFICDICGYIIEDEDEIIKHMQGEHGKCLVK